MKSPVFLYHALAAACMLLTVACSNSENIGTWDATKPDGGLYQLEAQPATNIEFDRATLTGTIKIPNHLKVVEYGFYCGTEADNTHKACTEKVDGMSQEPFSCQVTSLNANTTYYYCVYAVTDYVDKDLHRYSDKRTLSGEMHTFTTPGVPTFIRILEPTVVDYDGATLRGSITSTPLEDVVSYGFGYGTSESYMKTIEVGTTPITNEYSYTLTNLRSNTKYSYYAYVKLKRNDITKTYNGSTLAFTTTYQPKFTRDSYKCTKTDSGLEADLAAEFNLYGHSVKEAGFLISKTRSMTLQTQGNDIQIVRGNVKENTCTGHAEFESSRYVRPYLILDNDKEIYGDGHYLYDGYDMSISY